MHGRFHTSAQDDYDWTLRPKAQLKTVPNHDCGHDDDAERKALIQHLTPTVLSIIDKVLELASLTR